MTSFASESGRHSTSTSGYLLPTNLAFAQRNNVPPLMIHASTSANWGVNHGRHIPGIDDCLLDRFLEVAHAELACATGQAKIEDVVIDAALPFASLFAGLLIVSELVRAHLPNYPQVPNFALFDWYGPLETIQAWNRDPRVGCICGEQSRAMHDRFNAETKYRSLFGFS